MKSAPEKLRSLAKISRASARVATSRKGASALHSLARLYERQAVEAANSANAFLLEQRTVECWLTEPMQHVRPRDIPLARAPEDTGHPREVRLNGRTQQKHLAFSDELA